jgi:hypothetical protein
MRLIVAVIPLTFVLAVAAERPHPTTRPPSTAFSADTKSQDTGAKSEKPAAQQWRKSEITEKDARALAEKQKRDFKPQPRPAETDVWAPLPPPQKPGLPEVSVEDQWRDTPPDQRWRTWLKFTPEKRFQLWRDLDPDSRHEYWTRMTVHERVAFWDQMTEEEKERGWERMLPEDRAKFCATLPSSEKTRWSARLDRPLVVPEADVATKFRPARPEEGYTPKSTFIEAD